ncbi:putative NADPH reductase TAH18 [Glarea lozoyensis 74030]|uniref:Putative NADPH reductase TAH18 n=1 Tax=Glarea lozoyensis (strain ATCC 74030 / MF5533) TaxID=1104152 RepID=H0EJF1_GLAL7|nr:putative NADPH reductase TAH18 [Glarea lozoyensis 74030]
MAEAIQGQRHDRNALVLYGSETGNSQDVAEQLGRIAERLHFAVRVCEMDQVEIKLLPKHKVVIFVLSTTGQGEFPKNARKLWKSLLRKRLPPGCLGHVNFTTFGLGDSSYAHWGQTRYTLEEKQTSNMPREPRPCPQIKENIPGEADPVDRTRAKARLLPWPDAVEARLIRA